MADTIPEHTPRSLTPVFSLFCVGDGVSLQGVDKAMMISLEMSSVLITSICFSRSTLFFALLSAVVDGSVWICVTKPLCPLGSVRFGKFQGRRWSARKLRTAGSAESHSSAAAVRLPSLLPFSLLSPGNWFMPLSLQTW